MADKIYVGDIGTVIDVDCNETITGATGQKLIVKKPNGTTVEWTATIQGTDTLRHITIANDLDVAGEYLIQPYLTLSGWTGRGKTARFKVYEKFR